MIPMESTGRRIKYIRNVLGMTQEGFADFLGGISRGAVGNWERNQGIKMENLEMISEKTSVTMDWLAHGRGDLPKPTAIPDQPDAIRHTDDDLLVATGIPNLSIHAGIGDGGLLEAHADAGGGGFITKRHIDGFWSFPPTVRARLPNLGAIQAFPVVGDSMSPTFESGSVVFVDTTRRIPTPEDIYAINYGDGLLIKRVKLIPQSSRVRIISDNQQYGTDEMERNDLQVYGRVVGYFRWRG